MEKIKDFEQYQALISSAKDLGYTQSNCFFLPASIREKTAIGSLRYLFITAGLLILDDIGDFYRCYYYFSESKLPESVCLDKPAVIEFPFRGEMNDRQKRQVASIEAMGFRLGRESGQMSVSHDKIRELIPDSHRVTHAETKDISAIRRLLCNSFNPLYAFLPDSDELSAAIREQRVFVIRRDENVTAVLNSAVNGKAATIQHVAVAADYRGMGLGKELVQAYHRYYQGKVSEFCHWVDLHNLPAVSLYQKFGYHFNVRKANEYIKEG